MLHRAKMLEQLKNIEHRLFVDITPELEQAYRIFNTISDDALFKACVIGAASQLALPVWAGRLADVVPLDAKCNSYIVTGVDGSQIFPDRHQGSSCFLINIGTVCLRYGMQAYAKLSSQPYVFAGNDVENESFFTQDTTQDGISCRRHMLELQHGLLLMQELERSEIPQLLLFDGSLLFWHLATKPFEIQHYFAAQYMTVLQELFQEQHLVASYISLPHSKELVTLIRFALANYDPLLYKELKILDNLIDKHILSFYLQENERTGIFKSNVSISCLYPEHLRPYFFYIRTHKEIVRVEIPAWIAQNATKVDIVAAVIADQINKGQGYPIALAEAHEQAVVKGADREFFYHVIEKLSIEQKRVLVPSQKSLKKRAMSI